MVEEAKSKFRVGQVAMLKRGTKRGIPAKILEVITDDTGVYYRIDRRNCLAEHMLRELSAEERGQK